MNLFSDVKISAEIIKLQQAELFFFENFWLKDEADAYFNTLRTELHWQQGEIKIFGKNIFEPRLTAWYGDVGKNYTYSGVKREPLEWHPLLKRLKSDIENPSLRLKSRNSSEINFNFEFNSVLCNFYRNGKDSMGYHADNEKELGINPLIASVNFGVTRRFLLKHRTDKNLKHEILLTHGSVLFMAGEMQHYWLHAIPKSTHNLLPRINLTFRNIIS